MYIAVLSGFLVSLAAPSLHRLTRSLTGWILALLPAGLFVYFASFAGRIAAGQAIAVSYPWVPSLGIHLSFQLDGLALLFALLITGIGALVMIYAAGYLEGHEHLGRFYAFLTLFMASMLGVVLADNLFLLFVFWELTSISSYLLIGFEHQEESSRRAALQALLVTGGGGLALLAGLVLLSQIAGTAEFSAFAPLGESLRGHALYTPVLLLVLAGAFTKSAQFPFHFWLPNAMEAPTPVSAYLHSATMVKAGIYLLARLSQALGGTQAWLILVGGAGAATILVGAYLALNSGNLKRMLAYSTISALGVMTLMLGIGSETAMLAFVVFLLAHALYKGALFMIAGAIYHETGTQEVNELGRLRGKMPLLAGLTFLAALSMFGFGPVLSFIGKELVLQTLLETPAYRWLFLAAAVAFSASAAAVALILFLRPFFGASRPTPKQPHEPPLALWLGPALLALAGLVLGLFPGLVAGNLVGPAVAATGAGPVEADLALWHGLNPALGLSVLSILLGLVIFRGWDAWQPRARWLAERVRWGPERVYEALVGALPGFSARLTGMIQTGRLHDYLFIIAATTTGLVVATLVLRGEGLPGLILPELRFFELFLALLMLTAAWIVINSRSRLKAVAALGVVGSSVAVTFILFGAPDLAMTQFLIETITVILLVLILYHLPRFANLSGRAARLRDAVIAVAAGGMMTLLVLIVESADRFPPISSYFVENSAPLAHGRNIVNAILVDFRGLDTMGEITVLSLAAIGVFALLKLRRPQPKPVEEEREMVR